MGVCEFLFTSYRRKDSGALHRVGYQEATWRAVGVFVTFAWGERIQVFPTGKSIGKWHRGLLESLLPSSGKRTQGFPIRWGYQEVAWGLLEILLPSPERKDSGVFHKVGYQEVA